MKMQDVKEVKEVRSVDEANELLDQDNRVWEILRITKTVTGLLFIFGRR